MDFNDDYDSKRTIEYMRNNMLNRKNRSVYSFPVNGITIMSQLVKKQNYLLLKKIADDKFFNDDDKEYFINKYLKVNYYTPEQKTKRKNNYKNIFKLYFNY